MQRDDLLKRLAYHTKAWYNGFVTTVVRATAAQDTTEARHVIAEYVFSREHLPDVVAIKVLLDRDKALQSLANDVEVFIRLLVRVDPAGAYMCVVRELRDIPDITEDWSNGRYDYTELPENDLVVSLQRQVQVITNQIYEIRFGSEGAVP